ncbi:MAG TPA: hypothetical protein VG013_05880, partial [Gemmataceae bacterium]|nr:hypothetical protein [Gemmataceae bacterium]
MPTLECPRLRPCLAAAVDDSNPYYVVIWDRLGLADGPQRVTLREFGWVQMLDGRHTLRDIQAETMRLAGGELVPLEAFTALVEKLDEALFLDGPRFRKHVDGPIREPSCIGCYEAEPEALRRQLHGL